MGTESSSSRPPRPRWYELEPVAAAYLAGLALALLAFGVVRAAAGPRALDGWAVALAAAIVWPAAHFGRRLPRRALVPAMVLLWVAALAVAARAA
jgi:hypothetical protein